MARGYIVVDPDKFRSWSDEQRSAWDRFLDQGENVETRQQSDTTGSARQYTYVDHPAFPTANTEYILRFGSVPHEDKVHMTQDITSIAMMNEEGHCETIDNRDAQTQQDNPQQDAAVQPENPPEQSGSTTHETSTPEGEL